MPLPWRLRSRVGSPVPAGPAAGPSRGSLLRATEALNEYLDWPGVRQVCQVRRRVEQKGSVSMETRYAITSLGRETGPGKPGVCTGPLN